MFQNFTLVVMGILGNVFAFIAPLWIAVIFGVVVGWAWKPKWAIEPNTYDWTSFFKFRVPWSNDSELRNQPGFSVSSGSASEGEKGLRGLVTEGDLQNLCKLVEEKDSFLPLQQHSVSADDNIHNSFSLSFSRFAPPTTQLEVAFQLTTSATQYDTDNPTSLRRH